MVAGIQKEQKKMFVFSHLCLRWLFCLNFKKKKKCSFCILFVFNKKNTSLCSFCFHLCSIFTGEKRQFSFSPIFSGERTGVINVEVLPQGLNLLAHVF